MSFSANVKTELCRLPINHRPAAIAEAYGILLYCNTFTPSLIRIVTENEAFAARLPKLFRKAFGFGFDTEPSTALGKQIFLISNEEKLRFIFETFGDDPNGSVTLHVNYGVLEDEAERIAFLRGAFLAGGSVTDPLKRYHLELITSHHKVSMETYALLLDVGFSPKTLSRNGSDILYFKQSDYIEDFLTALGAPVCAMGVMEAKVEKDLRNGINRRCNCETANLTKVVDASLDQIAAIHALEASGELEKLPGKLQETAKLRLDNPEATLTELAEMLDPPVSKSAMNHRMRKLIELSKAE
ncbi:MAG: DNA-binding protein WhiA [Oscillospiraceae bacterium]|nr:DNA-binding protein WhiA [Oscillospiraceae bacterium]